MSFCHLWFTIRFLAMSLPCFWWVGGRGGAGVEGGRKGEQGRGKGREFVLYSVIFFQRTVIRKC